MKTVGITPVGSYTTSMLRFQGAKRPEGNASKVSTAAVDADKEPDEKTSSSPLSSVMDAFKQAFQKFLDSVLSVLAKFLNNLAQSLQAVDLASEGSSKAGQTKKVPIPTEDEIDDDEVDAMMAEEEWEGPAKLPELFQHVIDKAHAVTKSFQLELLPKPVMLLGHPADQQSLLQVLGQDPTFGKNVFKVVVENDEGAQVGEFARDIRSAYSMWMQKEYPDDEMYVAEHLKAFLSEVQGRLEQQSQGKSRNKKVIQPALLYLVGDQNLREVLPHLPSIAKQNPNIKIVLAGMQQLPTELSAESAFQMSFLEVPKPSLEEAISNFNQYGKPYQEQLEKGYGVKVQPETIEAVAKMLMDKTGRPPGKDQMLGVLEKLVIRTCQDNPVPEGEENIAVLDITPQHLKAFQGRLESFLQAHAENPQSSEAGSFFKVAPKTGVKFSDVIGQDEAVNQLKTLAKLMKNYTLLQGLRENKGADIKIPKLLIFSGEPGTGKTMLAKAFAEESGLNMIHLSATDLVEMYVGLGAKRVREVFTHAYERRPAVVFIDEIDAVARSRDGSPGGGQEVENTLNAILTEVEGFSSREGVTTIVATNRPELLDSAFSSRKSAQIDFKLPNKANRLQILQTHQRLSGFKFADDVNMDALAEDTKGFSGRRLEKLIERSVNRVLSTTGETLESYASKANPDYQELFNALPAVTQTILQDELQKMQKEGDPDAGDKGTFGFHAIRGTASDE